MESKGKCLLIFRFQPGGAASPPFLYFSFFPCLSLASRVADVVTVQRKCQQVI